MDLTYSNMKTENNRAHITRYELAIALFRAEDYDKDNIHSVLNIMFNAFCEEEKKRGHNVSELTFNINSNNIEAIRFIQSVN